MATFLSRTASYAALQRPKSNPELRTKEPLQFLPPAKGMDKENISLELTKYLLLKAHVNQL